MYKNKPLVRKGDIIYYGSMSEEVVAMLIVKSTRNLKDLEISDDVRVQLILTDSDVSPKDLIVKTTVKSGLFEALDVAGIWIDRYNKKLGE